MNGSTFQRHSSSKRKKKRSRISEAELAAQIEAATTTRTMRMKTVAETSPDANPKMGADRKRHQSPSRLLLVNQRPLARRLLALLLLRFLLGLLLQPLPLQQPPLWRAQRRSWNKMAKRARPWKMRIQAGSSTIQRTDSRRRDASLDSEEEDPENRDYRHWCFWALMPVDPSEGSLKRKRD